MMFKNETDEAKNVRYQDDKGNYHWKWVEVGNLIELDEAIGENNGLCKVNNVVKEIKSNISGVEIETKRVQEVAKESRGLGKNKVKSKN